MNDLNSLQSSSWSTEWFDELFLEQEAVGQILENCAPHLDGGAGFGTAISKCPPGEELPDR